MSDPTVTTTTAVPAPVEATPAEASDVRNELNVMFDTWQSIARLNEPERKRVGSWLKDHLGL